MARIAGSAVEMIGKPRLVDQQALRVRRHVQAGAKRTQVEPLELESPALMDESQSGLRSIVESRAQDFVARRSITLSAVSNPSTLRSSAQACGLGTHYRPALGHEFFHEPDPL